MVFIVFDTRMDGLGSFQAVHKESFCQAFVKNTVLQPKC